MLPILDIKSLNKNYGPVKILKDINVAIDPGDFLVLVGPSGCGKSTLLNCIAGLEPISGGAINIDGQDMSQVSPKDRDIAMVFVEATLLWRQAGEVLTTQSICDRLLDTCRRPADPNSPVALLLDLVEKLQRSELRATARSYAGSALLAA